MEHELGTAPIFRAANTATLSSCGRYRIVYQIAAGTVLVDDIQDCRQLDSGSLLAE
jgi:hypothetical protein